MYRPNSRYWNCQPCRKTHRHAVMGAALAPFRLHFHWYKILKGETALILYKPCSEPGKGAGEEAVLGPRKCSLSDSQEARRENRPE